VPPEEGEDWWFMAEEKKERKAVNEMEAIMIDEDI
jgi:hypothetical protein